VRRLVAALGLLSSLPALCGAQEPAPLPAGFHSEILPNGLRLTILEDPTQPVVATQIWYRVGSANEDRDSRGLAHLFEHLMFGGTERYSERALWELHHRHGGDVNAYTTPDETVYVSVIPPEGHGELLEIGADQMGSLVLDSDKLENEKKIVTEELRLRTENDPMSRLYTVAQRRLLGEHPYAFDPSGSREDIARATVASCRRFYETWYRPENAHVVIVGPVDSKETAERVRRLFGRLPAGGNPPRQEIPALDQWTFPEKLDLEEDLPPVETAVLAFPLPPADSPDWLALQLLHKLIGGGTTDLFAEEIVRKRRRALEAGLQAIFLRRGGAFLFYSVSLPYRRERTAFRHMEEALRTLARMDWLTEERLLAAKRRLRREELGRVYFASSLAHAIGEAGWWFGDERRAFDRAAAIERIGREEVASVFRRYIAGRKPVRLYVRPERVPLLVRLFGWVVPLVRR
jgi:zinc protease